MIKKIAFIGATGMLGKPVAIALSESGFEVTALVRNTSVAKQVLPSSIHLIEGDMKNEQDLRKLLTGQDALYLNLSVKQSEKPHEWHSEAEGIKLLLPIANETGISRIGYLSSVIQDYQGTNGFNWWVFDVKLKAVEMIKESGIPFTIFYASTFMETIVGQYKLGRFLLLAGESKYKQHFISVIDFAKQVTHSFQLTVAANKDYYIQGLEGFNSDDAIAVFAKHYLKGKLITMKAPVGLIKFYGLFIQKMNYGYHIIETLNNYPEKFKATDTWNDLGKPVITLKKFAEDC